MGKPKLGEYNSYPQVTQAVRTVECKAGKSDICLCKPWHVTVEAGSRPVQEGLLLIELIFSFPAHFIHLFLHRLFF